MFPYIKRFRKRMETAKNRIEYSCEFCSYFTSNRTDYNKHLDTRKHQEATNGNKSRKEKHLCFHCNKQYASRAGLWKHAKSCGAEIIQTTQPIVQANSSAITPDVVMEIMKQNKDVQNLLIEQNNKLMEKISEMSMVQNNTITNSNNVVNQNNSFNLNFFLNEQCKNAVNLVDFIESLQVGVKDLERTGKLGYVEGISQIFLDGLKELDVYNRPIHCTDLKRETVYVRDQDKWEKENEEKTKLRHAVKRIAVKNIKQLPNWEVENPEYSDFDSKKNDEYMAISKSSLGGYDSDEDKKYKDNIIRNVLKKTKIPSKDGVLLEM